MYPETLEETSKEDSTLANPTSPLLPKNSSSNSVQDSESDCRSAKIQDSNINGPHLLASYLLSQNRQQGNNIAENGRPQNFKGGCVRRLHSDQNSSSSMERQHPERQRHNQHVKFNIGACNFSGFSRGIKFTEMRNAKNGNAFWEPPCEKLIKNF